MSRNGKSDPNYCLLQIDQTNTDAPVVATEGTKCKHGSSSGRWGVFQDGKYFVFNPATQIQKDLWLSQWAGKEAEQEYEKRLASLRWVCLTCMNIQLP